ncbi:tyrosine-protein phosphatase [Tomitella biformata]|uniref:tyrosine-protein phosphatase n=1 Tax=Tomitella biformata TaxID=630403 RepID=UPI0004BBE7B8|nr:tyrosine-protein phosphatase [Tomitella biformata]
MTEAHSGDSAGFQVAMSDGGEFTLSWALDEVSELTLSASEDPNDPDAATVELAFAAGGSAEITGLAPDRRWYFTVAGPTGRAVTSGTRQVALRGAQNARDIGGYPTVDGRSVRWGKVFRADSLSALTDEDVDYLDRSRIRTVVDFRGPQEVAAAGPDRVSAGTTHIQTPLMDDSTNAFAAVMSTALAEGDRDAVIEMLGGGKAEELSEHGFVRQLGRPTTMAGYADTLRRIADAPDEPLLYHCAGGKDRTSMMTALLLGILGVPDQAIVDDFVLSNHFNKHRNNQRFAALAARGVDIELVRPLMEQRPSQIEAVLAAIREQYGDWDAFALECLKLSATEIESIRRALLSN